jgi:hypothetical protein
MFAVMVALLLAGFVYSVFKMGRDERLIEEHVAGRVRFRRDGVGLRSTWRAPLSWRVSSMSSSLVVTAEEAFLFRSRGAPMRLALRVPDEGRVDLGYRLDVTDMRSEGRGLVIEGRHGWASATLRLEIGDADAALDALRAAPRRR